MERFITLCAFIFVRFCVAGPMTTTNLPLLFQNAQPTEPASVRRSLEPTLARSARSFGSMEMQLALMLPLLQTLQRQPPVQNAVPGAVAETGRAGTPPAPPAPDPLASLLPLLLLTGLPGLGGGLGPLGGFGGGSSFGSNSGSFEGGGYGIIGGGDNGLNSILPLLAIAAAAAPAPAPAPAPAATLMATPDSVFRESKGNLQLSGGTNLAKLAGSTDKKSKRDPPPPSVRTEDCAVHRPRSTICDDLPVDKILALKNGVVVMKGRKMFRVRPNGDPFDLSPNILNDTIELMTATATIGRSQYIFQGDKVTKYDMNFKPTFGSIQKNVTAEFPGVLTPVDGVFQLNSHTYVFISGAKYVYFQPDGNPKVDPRYSPQYLDNVPGVPPTIDSAFTLKERKFLHKQGSIFELAPDEMKAIREIPVASSITEGWLKCPDAFSSGCLVRQGSISNQTTTTTEDPLPMP